MKVVNQAVGIKHRRITTLHDLTNTQVIVDSFKPEVRRGRSGTQSLIPTTTGSSKAIGMIFQELQWKSNGHAVQVRLLNGSLTETLFELEKEITQEK